MDFSYPIVGFRQDRSGARLICLLDIIRLSRKFGVEARYLWLSQPKGPYPELADPGVFFAPELVSSHIEVVSEHPDVVGRKPLSSIAHVNKTAQFIGALGRGETFLSGAMIEATRFSDETPAQVGAELHDIVASLPLAPRLKRALERARAAIEKVGRRDAAAIHVRRGDILDGVPWSYRAWQSKYVPDEFFRKYVEMRDGPVIAFSDTPDAVRHLGSGDPRILSVDDLLSGERLSMAERDMLELLLMSGCEEIAAPASSAFSMAAAMIGSAKIVQLPVALPKTEKIAAYDRLLDRVIQAQDSFFAPGDLAQSMVFATQHAIAQGRADELLDSFDQPAAFLDRFPFVRYWLAMAAFSIGKRSQARNLATRALGNKNLRNAERQAANQLLEITRLSQGKAASEDPAPEDEAGFLELCFNSGGGPVMPLLCYKVLGRGGAASQALMFDPALVEALSQQPEPGMTAFMVDDRDKNAQALPLWTFLSEWSELIDANALRDGLSRYPALPQKTEIGEDLLREFEPLLTEGEKPGGLDGDAIMRLAFCASKLSLHGRLRRAFLLLHWLDGLKPNDPLTHKRLADSCYRASNIKAGDRWLRSAMELAPENPLLRLSAARRAISTRRFDDARALLDQANGLWSGLDLTRQTERELRRATRDRQEA